MVTGSPPSDTRQTASSPKRPIWPWAAGSILIPLLIIIGTLAGARAVAQGRPMPPPVLALSPLRVATVIQPAAGVALWNLVASQPSSSPIALVYSASSLSACLPGSPCPRPPLATTLTTYDAVTGGQLTTQSISPVNLSHCALLTSAQDDPTYLLCPGQAQVISPTTGLATDQIALPTWLDASRAALDGATNTLYAIDGDALYAFDLATGAQVARQPLSGQASSPIVDASLHHVDVLLDGGGSHPTLSVFQERTLTPAGSAALPAGWRAGPLDGAFDQLYLFGPGGVVGDISLNALAHSLTRPYPAVTPSRLASLRGVSALGWDITHLTLVALFANHVTAYDTQSLQPYAEAPVSGAWDPQRPLPVDSVYGMLYAPDRSGAIVALSLARPTAKATPDAATALLIARAGFGALLHDTSQTPPFLDVATFPATETTVTRNFAIHFSDFGWRGPYPGHASAKVIKNSAPGDYVVVFAVDWNQLFVHTHSWTVELLSDGRIKILTDTGDAIP